MTNNIKYLVLVCILSILFSNNLRAEIVLYCQSEIATGLFNENGNWTSGKFKLDRYTVKFNDSFSTLEGLTRKPMVCTKSYPNQMPNRIFCVHQWGSHQTFQYDTVSRRFLYLTMSSVGYIENGNDTETIEGGRCTKF